MPPGRPRRGSVRHLEWRIRLFGAGAILAVVGIAAEQRWMVNLAIGVLLVGLLLRLVGDRSGPPGDGHAPGEPGQGI